MDVRKTILELTSQLSEINYDSEEDYLLLKDSNPRTDTSVEPSVENNDYDVESSQLRKANESVILPPHIYGGKTTTRKKCNSFSAFSEENHSKGDSSNEGSGQSHEDSTDGENENEDISEDVTLSEAEEKTLNLSQNTLTRQNKIGSAGCKIYSSASKNISSDVKKGSAIRNQLRFWESLLEGRIKLQKALIASNCLPTKKNWVKFKIQLDSESRSKVNNCIKSLLVLLHKITELQEELLKRSQDHESCKVQKSSELSEEVPSDESEIESEDDLKEEKEETQPLRKKRKLNDYSLLLKDGHNKFIPFRNAVIQKWNDKTKVSTGKMTNSNFSAFDHSTLKQIEQIMSDKSRLVNRTRIKRTELQESNTRNQEDAQKTDLDVEIFDDTDFYHKLLRDYIERKSVDVTSSRTERQIIELQTLRSKMKKDVDTKSTKGRKLRYVVLPKLVNFMAPDPYNTWSEQAETELYNSLFGKIKV